MRGVLLILAHMVIAVSSWRDSAAGRKWGPELFTLGSTREKALILVNYLHTRASTGARDLRVHSLTVFFAPP